MLAVVKKELKSYLLSPLGYIFIGLFLFVFSVFFLSTVFNYQSINFEYLFFNGATILTFLSPLLTMRMFSEERKSGTEQLILTSPRSLFSIVLGKFCAAGIIMLITILLTSIYFGILCHFGEPSLVVALTTMAGFFLLSLAYISFGMFASSLTENQIIAAILSIVVFMAMWFLPYLYDGLSMFSLIDKFQHFPYGIISINEIIAFVSFIVMFISLTLVVLKRRKFVG